jgi:hypothetical protein
MKYIKNYNKLFEWYFYDEFHKEKIRDVDYYLDRIKKEKVGKDSIDQLFHWACVENFSELVLALNNFLDKSSLIRLNRSITYLDFKTFKTILEKDNLYKNLLKDRDFLSNVIYYGDDLVEKVKYLETLGFNINDDFLRYCCYSDKLELIKYLVSKGLDPKKIQKDKITDIPQNCLDIATSYNKKGIKIIKYLVEELNTPVTYRHMNSVIDNPEALDIIMKSKNIIDDYSYSMYSTNGENNRQFTLYKFLNNLSSKNLIKYIKILADRDKKRGYDFLQNLNSKKDWQGFDKKFDEYLDPSQLEIAYYIIDNYDGDYENATTTQFITHNNEDFWLKKMKENPSIIKKLLYLDDKVRKSYKYQKILMEADEKNLKYIKNIIHPNIIKEYDHLPEVLDIIAKKYNL